MLCMDVVVRTCLDWNFKLTFRINKYDFAVRQPLEGQSTLFSIYSSSPIISTVFEYVPARSLCLLSGVSMVLRLKRGIFVKVISRTSPPPQQRRTTTAAVSTNPQWLRIRRMQRTHQVRTKGHHSGDRHGYSSIINKD